MAYLGTAWYKDVEQLRSEAAAFINATPGEIAFIKNTSEGLATVAGGIAWRHGDRIVTTGVEYPANMYPWMDVCSRYGVELVQVAEETAADGSVAVPTERICQEASHPRTRLVALSHVQFGSGQRLDVAAVGALCRANGKLLCVDAIQSLGVVPVDVRAMNIDYLAADGHKWMLGPEGAGIFYCRAELLSTTRPLIIGWMNMLHAQEFGKYDFTLRPDAARFECGSWNIIGLHGLRASLGLLAGIGMDAVSLRIKALTDQLIDGLCRKGYCIASPRTNNQWSGIISFASARHDHHELVHGLRKSHRIELVLRLGRLRCSPHFYNTEKQIDRLVDVLPGH